MCRLKYVFLIVVVFFLTQEYVSQVLWYGNPDLSVRENFRRLDPNGNSNPTGTRCVDDPNRIPFVTTPIDAEYGKFWRVTKPASRKRAELARTTGTRNSLIPQNGETYYYGWRWRINSSPDIIEDVTVFQWKTDEKGNKDSNKQHYPLNMEYNGSVLTFNAYGPAEPNWDRPGSISLRKTTLWSKAIPKDKWVSFVIKIKVDDSFDSTNNRYNGYVEFWFNGVQQTLSNSGFNQYKTVLDNSNKTAYHKTFDGGEVYPKWGAYNENACDIEVITDFDEMRVAATFKDALPENSIDNSEISGLEGTYKIKNVLTGNYMTYNAIDNNIIASVEKNDQTQSFRIVENGNEIDGIPLFNINSEIVNVGVLRAENVNLFATTSSPPSTSNPNSFRITDIGNGVYHFLANTSSSRYLAENLDSKNVGYTSNTFARTEWVLERQTLSVKKNTLLDEFRLYPNPVKNLLRVSTNTLKINKVEVFNFSGKKISSKQVDNGNEVKLNISYLATGIYLIRIHSAKAVSTKKFIKK